MLVARSVLHRDPKAKHTGFRVRAKLRAVGREGINVAGCVGQVEAPCGNNVTIASLTDKLGCEIKGRGQIGEAYQRHFT